VLGTLPFGAVISSEYSKNLINLAWDNGIRNFDIAPLYGNGMASEIINACLGERKKNSEFWVSIGLQKQPDERGVFAVTTIKQNKVNILKSVYEMLEKLQIDYISVLNLHAPDDESDMCEVLETLSELKVSGIINKLSISNFNSVQLKTIKKAEIETGVNFDIFQIHGNMIEQKLINEFLNEKESREIFCYRPLARGLLTREYSNTNHKPENSRATRGWRLERYMNSRFLLQIEKFQELSSKFNVSQGHLALYWIFNIANLDGVVLGIRTVEQLLDVTNYKHFDPSSELLSSFTKYLNDYGFKEIASTLPVDYFEK
jgi:aryl-alcohol dehydrogenase-like predicted oxidoreductase